MARKRITTQVSKIVHEYIRLLKKDDIPIEGVYVFSSRVSGRARKDSDIDVAIISPRLHNSLSSTKYLLGKAHELESPALTIEPHGFHSSDFVDENPVVWEIKTKGVQLHA
ncbi:MAG: nucleotidyltransferase domain-containing protein [Candidatus Kerfeldbacteria bacterium]|nr:nucleotidyltransferase domain-containing protein [Candidatus Kerfeldbacteria bacterium]